MFKLKKVFIVTEDHVLIRKINNSNKEFMHDTSGNTVHLHSQVKCRDTVDTVELREILPKGEKEPQRLLRCFTLSLLKEH